MAENWYDLLNGGELETVQNRQPAPGLQPAPLDQDALRGFGGQPRQQRAPHAAQPRQPQPAASGIPDGTSDYYLGNEDIAKLSPGDRDAYIKQRNRWLDAQGDAYTKQQQQSAPQPRAPTPAPSGQSKDWYSELNGVSPTPQAQPQTAPPAAPGSKLGQHRGDRVRETIVGKSDPNYAGIPSALTALDREQGVNARTVTNSLGRYAVGASDQDLGRLYADRFGSAYVRTETDANGYPVIVYKDKAGQEAKAYVNRPGLDGEDVTRGVVGALPFAKAGQVVGRMAQSLPWLGRAGAQAGGQAATSLGQDAAGVATGATTFDPYGSGVKAAIAGGGGIAGEALSSAVNPLLRKMTERKLFDPRTGALTPEGEAAARAAGYDPADITKTVAQDFAKAFAKTGDADAAFRQSVSNEFGIRRSMGEMTGNRDKLLQEQQMRGGTFGTRAREQVESFDTLQRVDIERAVRGVSPPGSASPSMAERLAPDRKYQLAAGVGRDDAGRNVQSGLTTARASADLGEDIAWSAVPKVKATPEALAELDSTIAAAFAARGGVLVDDAVTPMAARMGKELDQFKTGGVPAKSAGVFPDSPAGDVQTMRKRLLAMRQSAQTTEDKRAAGAVYNAFLDWEVVAAEKAGDLAAAAQARTARGVTRDLHEIFDGKLKAMTKNADTPEGLINALFTGDANTKTGSVTALQQIKRAYDTYLTPDLAKQSWDDVRLAYWLKATGDRGNEVKNPAALASAIKNMIGSQPSVVKTLYSPQEIATMRRLSTAMDEIKRKNPNTSWSAIGVGSLLKDGYTAILGMIGGNTVASRTLGGVIAKPVAGSYGAAQARRATGDGQGAQLPGRSRGSLGGVGGAIGNNQSQQ